MVGVCGSIREIRRDNQLDLISTYFSLDCGVNIDRVHRLSREETGQGCTHTSSALDSNDVSVGECAETACLA